MGILLEGYVFLHTIVHYLCYFCLIDFLNGEGVSAFLLFDLAVVNIVICCSSGSKFALISPILISSVWICSSFSCFSLLLSLSYLAWLALRIPSLRLSSFLLNSSYDSFLSSIAFSLFYFIFSSFSLLYL